MSILNSINMVETIDFTSSGVVADLQNFTASDATSILGNSGVGNELTLKLDGNDMFSVSGGAFYTQAANTYTFYSDAGLTNEIARVSII